VLKKRIEAAWGDVAHEKEMRGGGMFERKIKGGTQAPSHEKDGAQVRRCDCQKETKDTT